MPSRSIESVLGNELYERRDLSGDGRGAGRRNEGANCRTSGRRGDDWRTVEEPLDLVGALTANADPARPILVDCLTLWLGNLMGAGRDIDAETTALAARLQDFGGPVVLVSNEVGLGIVPDNALARDFRDHAGRLNQDGGGQ